MRSLLSRLSFWKTTNQPQSSQNLFHNPLRRSLLYQLFPFFFKDATHIKMDIRKDQFPNEVIRLLQNVADAHFISFDFEFSGISERNRERVAKPNLQEYYEETRRAVHEYQPLQIGLTIVKLDEDKGEYILESYNLNISPVPSVRERYFTRKWSMHSGAISFLQRNGFDFGKQMTHGVPYLSIQEECQARINMRADSKREDMLLKAEDQFLVQHVRDSIGNWQSQPKEEQEEFINIPSRSADGIPAELNSYQRRLVHQVVQNEFPAMRTHGMGHFIQITNPSSQKQASQKAVEEQQRERDLSRAVGLRWLIDGIIGKDISKIPTDYILPALPIMTKASEGDKPVNEFLHKLQAKLRDRRKILVGHNCLIDIMFLYKLAIGVLPEKLSEFVDHVHDMFPAIVDTKYLSSSYSEKYGRSQLGDVEKDLRDERGGPEISTPVGFDRYVNDAHLHEAGYDSYITAIVAIKMSSKLLKDGSMKKKDHNRQQEEVAKIAAAVPPDFGVQEGYVTATETLDSTSGISKLEPTEDDSASVSTSTPTKATTLTLKSSDPPVKDSSHTHAHANSVTSTFSSDYTFSASDTTSSPTSVVAVKSRRNDYKASRSIDWTDESQVAELRSAFASSSIYEKLDLNNASMPGEDASEPADPVVREMERLDKLVKSGRMMPRWAEEGAFWDFYGNKLQANGTMEGVLKLVE